ncbi:neuromedin-U isoform X2 [Takifugu flavidus]|nr:neuromedin-U isoform X2 [Takifugu flavidus]XP_056895293.1 neuromedin-U isoform X2 [Takifugu flavidus]
MQDSPALLTCLTSCCRTCLPLTYLSPGKLTSLPSLTMTSASAFLVPVCSPGHDFAAAHPQSALLLLSASSPDVRPEALIRLKSSKHKGKRHRLREMRTFQSQSQAAQRGASSRPNGGGGGSVSPFSPANIILISALLILTIPVCYSAPAEAQKIMTDELFSEIGAACSSYLSEDLTFQVTDALGELCVLMLVQKSKELPVRENSKRTDFHGPAGIQNRGYFLYRPRNGRRSIEYE